MDCMKVGRLIARLRREKGMTQKAVADRLNLSDRTISKWERGLGCPDVSLLHDLAELFGVNIEQILTGELSQNEISGGNMRKIKFYCCPDCGNVLFGSETAEITCCGRKLQPLSVSSADKTHELKIKTIEGELYASLNHEMTKQHYISFAACVSWDRIHFMKLYPEQEAAFRFPELYSGELYFYCSRDGLMKETISKLRRKSLD